MPKVELWLNIYRSMLDPHRFEVTVHPSRDLAVKAGTFAAAPPVRIEVDVEATKEPQVLPFADENSD